VIISSDLLALAEILAEQTPSAVNLSRRCTITDSYAGFLEDSRVRRLGLALVTASF
jgi:hypothetical protein